MFSLSRIIIVAGATLLMSGCQQEEHSLSYLLQHPLVLEKEYDRCQALQKVEPAEEAQCEVVNKAVKKISDVVSEQRSQPEKFGANILAAEMAVADYSAQLAKAHDAKSPKAKIDILQQKLDDKRNEVYAMLAILGMSPPE